VPQHIVRPGPVRWRPEQAGSAAPFESLANGRRLSDRVADRLLEHILVADLQAGDKLPTEAELGRQFEVSRTVIREAVRSLAARGVVDVRPGVGLSVARVDPSAASESLRLVVRARVTSPTTACTRFAERSRSS
jgi:DNA-binding FadR family transcriptional regulator